MVKRFDKNPILTAADISPSHPDWVIECVLNPGVFTFEGKIWMCIRVAERPIQKDNVVSFPIINTMGDYEIMAFDKSDPDLDLTDNRMVRYKGKSYLSTISHFRLMCSEDGIHFHEPEEYPTKIYGFGKLETFGIEDCRVSFINKAYQLTYTQVSESGVGVGLMTTVDWRTFIREGMILPPHNKDCAIFEHKIHNKYYCLHRPSGIDLGGNFIWIASSQDLLHWGSHQCILHTRAGMWDSVRVGAGAAPIRTNKGWLVIYHGADENQRYCLGGLLLDLEQPSKVLARSYHPIMEPEQPYEKNGFFGNVIFTNGHIVQGDLITMYYGASDDVICGAELSVNKILESLKRVNG